MMFTGRHERELAEIKALTYELDQRVQEGLEQLERIRDAHVAAVRREGDQPRAVRRPAAHDQRQAGSVADGNGADPLLAFVHIPKTAGATVITMFVSAYSKRDVRDAGNYLRNPERTVRTVTSPQKAGGRVLAGHVPYGVFREYLPPDTRYMTFLREPVDRVLSHYYRHIFAKDPRVDKALRRPGRTSDRRDREARAPGGH